MRWTRALLVPLLILLSLGASAPRTSAAAQVTPHFVATACPFKVGAGIVAGRDVRCGFVVVPQDRTSANKRTVRLAVAIFKSPSRVHHPDPFVYLQGGPGGRVIADLAPQITKKNIGQFTGDRDLILLDQRGTGYSQPSLACPELTALHLRTVDQNLSNQRQADLQVQTAAQCYDRLTAQGIDLSDYSSTADAADVADLRTALGYPSYNLYGVSYGTRLALTVMRTHPQDLRSVILDSVFPPQANLISGPPTSINRVLNVLFAGCVKDKACNAAFPNLRQTFYHAVTALDAHPVHFQTTDSAGKTRRVFFNGDGLANLVFQALYVTPFIPILPLMIAAADRGNYSIPAKIYGLLEFDDNSVSLGDYYSVECGEDAPFTTASRITAAAQALNPTIRPAILIGQMADLRVCSNDWHVARVPAAQKSAVTSAIPTLILSGEYDPITPPADSLLAAQTLSHSYRFVFPGMGHGEYLAPFTGQTCPDTIVHEFVDNPAQKPNASCIGRMTEPKFIVPSAG